MGNGWIPRKPSGNSAAAKFQQWIHDQQVRESRLGQVAGHRVINSTGGKIIIPNSSSRRRGSSGAALTCALRFAEDDFLVCRECDESGENIGRDDIYVYKPYKLRQSIASIQAWGTGLFAGETNPPTSPHPIFQEQTYTYAFDTTEPYMEYGETVEGSDPPVNEWGESESDYNVGEGLYQLRLNSVRIAVQDGITENQRVIPVWLKGDVIHAIELDEPGTTTIGLITDAGLSIDYIMVSDARQWARI